MLKENLNRLWSYLLIDQLVKAGAQSFFVSPGLRNAPLLSAIAAHPQAKLYHGPDERAQSFRALGHAKANPSGLRAVLVCTSGTALANYFPAVIEAKKTSTPLFILSADRASEQVLANEQQTIEQEQFYQRYVQYSTSLGAPTEEIAPRTLASILAQLIFRAHKGPVHLNCPFREPLDATAKNISPSWVDAAAAILESKRSTTNYWVPEKELAQDKIAELLDGLEHGILVVGELPQHTEQRPLLQLLEHFPGPVYLDVASGIKFNFSLRRRQLIPTLEHPEVQDFLKQHRPQFVLHLGGRTVSRQYYRWLASSPEIKVINISSWQDDQGDPAGTASWMVKACPYAVAPSLQTFFRAQGKRFTWPMPWENWHALIQEKLALIDAAPLGQAQISKTLLELLPEHSALYLGNSTTVRSFDNYTSQALEKKLHVHCNRGVSGIEGHMASALGLAEALELTTTLVLGDQAFLHDLNSLQLLHDSSAKVVVVLVNNFGGRIFELLPLQAEEKLLTSMVAPHTWQFAQVCQQFSLPYFLVQSRDDLAQAYTKALALPGSCVIEVLVDPVENRLLYQKLKTLKVP